MICHLVTTIINTLNQGEPFPPCMHTSLIQLPSISCSPSHPPDNHQDPRWSSLPLPLLEMLLSGRLEGHVEENTRKVSQQRVSDDSCGCCFIDHISLSLSLLLTGGNLSAVPPSEQDPDKCELFQRKCNNLDSTVDREIFTLKRIRVKKNFVLKKFHGSNETVKIY